MSKSSVVKGKAKKVVSGTANSSLDKMNDALVADFAKVVGGSLPAEMKVFEKACSMLETKKVGIAGLRASIEKANEIGSLPTIKPSHAQDFLNAKALRSLEGGQGQTLKALLNTAIQARKYFNGKEDKMNLAEALDFAETFVDLKESVPSQGEQKKRKARTENVIEKEVTIEDVLKTLGKMLKKKPMLKGDSIKDAEAVAFLLAQTLDRSKASPVKGKIVTRTKGGAVIDIDTLTERVKAVA
jgi:hypothetical protein